MSTQRTVVVIGLGYPTYKYEEAILREVGARLVLSDATGPDDVAAAIREADGVLNRTVPIPTSAIEGMQRCKVIARYGIGYDNIDVAACTRKGICVANVPDYCRHEVAEHALALLLAAIRRVVKHDRLIREGQWDICSRYKFTHAADAMARIVIRNAPRQNPRPAGLRPDSPLARRKGSRPGRPHNHT